MSRYLNANDTKRYIDVLPELVKSYNSAYHRSIGMSPESVSKENVETVRERLYPPLPPAKERALAVGTKVMISTNKGVFERGFAPTFQPQVYEISKRLNTVPFTYHLIDHSDQPLKGSFYRQELQPVSEKLQTFVIERIVRRRVKNGQRQVLIKWENYPETQNSWIAESALFIADADKKKTLKTSKQ